MLENKVRYLYILRFGSFPRNCFFSEVFKAFFDVTESSNVTIKADKEVDLCP